MGLIKQSIVGMEVDAMEIRAVEMAGSPMNPVIKALGSVALPTDTIRDGRVQDPSALGLLLASMWRQHGFKAKNACLAISNQDIIVRFASFPVVADEKMDKLIRFQASEYIPVPLDDVELDYAILGKVDGAEPPQVRVLLVAARKLMIEGFLDAFRHARLTVKDIGISMLAKTQTQEVSFSGAPTCRVQLSNDSGNVLVTVGNKPRLARLFNYSPGVQNTYRLMFDDFRHNQFHEPTDVQLKELLDPIVSEIRSSILYDQNQNPSTPIQKVILSGNLIKLRGIVPLLQQQIAYPTEVALPEKYIRNDPRMGTFFATDFNVCCDMATRGLEGK